MNIVVVDLEVDDGIAITCHYCGSTFKHDVGKFYTCKCGRTIIITKKGDKIDRD